MLEKATQNPTGFCPVTLHLEGPPHPDSAPIYLPAIPTSHLSLFLFKKRRQENTVLISEIKGEPAQHGAGGKVDVEAQPLTLHHLESRPTACQEHCSISPAPLLHSENQHNICGCSRGFNK